MKKYVTLLLVCVLAVTMVLSLGTGANRVQAEDTKDTLVNDTASNVITQGVYWQYFNSCLTTNLSGGLAYTFRGTYIAVLGTKDQACTFQVYIDDVLKATVDTTSNPAGESVFYEKDDLSDGIHRIEIRTEGGPYLFIKGFRTAASSQEVTFIDSASSDVVKTGTWGEETTNALGNLVSEGYAYGGSQLWSATSGAEMEFYFEGTYLSMYGQKSPEGGKVLLYIDDELIEEVDYHSADLSRQQLIFEQKNLSNTVHKVNIIVLEENKYTYVDTFITDGKKSTKEEWLALNPSADTHKMVLMDQTGSQVTTNGDFWTYSEGCLASDAENATLNFLFSGTDIAVIGKKSVAAVFEVSIDGVLVDTVDTASLPNGERIFYQDKDLTDGNHRIEIKRISGGYLLIKGFEVLKTSNEFAFIESDNTEVKMTGNWNKEETAAIGTAVSLGYARGGNQYWTLDNTATMELAFEGTYFSILGQKSREGGKAVLYLDGELVQELDFASTNENRQQIIFEKKDLDAGTHVIKIVPLENKYVYLDVFITDGQGAEVPTPTTPPTEGTNPPTGDNSSIFMLIVGMTICLSLIVCKKKSLAK